MKMFLFGFIVGVAPLLIGALLFRWTGGSGWVPDDDELAKRFREYEGL